MSPPASPSRGTPATPRVVAVVLNWRLPDDALRVALELEGSGEARLHTVLIDNGSGDGSAERLAEGIRGRSNVELLAFDENLGYCAAVNRGVARARELGAAYVLLLNNDVRLSPGFLAPLVHALEYDAGLAAVGPTIVTPDGRAWAEGGSVRFSPNLVVLHGQGREPAPSTAGPRAVGFLPGACALYRLEDLDAVGGLDEGYFMYWEDADLGARLGARGRLVVWLPWVRIVHEVSGSSGGGRSPLRKYMQAANTVRYLRRHGRAAHWVAFALFDVLLWPLTFLGRTGARAAWAKGVGLVAGLRGRPVTAADVRRWASG